MTIIPNNLINSKALCGQYLKSLIDVTQFDVKPEFIKFTLELQLTEQEVTFKIGSTPEIVDISNIESDVPHSVMKVICQKIEDAKNFYISFSSVLKFEKVDHDWMYGTMVLSPKIPDPISHSSEVVEPILSTEVTEIKHNVPEVVKPLEVSQVVKVKSAPTTYAKDTSVSTEDDNNPLELGELGVFVALKNTDGLTIKKKIDLPLKKFLPLLNGWLYCSQQLREFKQAIASTPHNALTLYLNPAEVWYIQEKEYEESITLDTWLLRETKELCDKLNCSRVDDVLFDKLVSILTPSEFRKYKRIKDSIVEKGHYHTTTVEIKRTAKYLDKKEQTSETVAEIRPQARGSIQRNKRFSIPEIGSIFAITPIKEEIDGQTYLVQEYIERDENIYTQKSQRIALFDGGQLLYYTDLEKDEKHTIDEHSICELKTVDGINIFPSTSINQIRLETLECSNPNDPVENHIYETKKRTYYVDKLGIKRPYSNASEIPAGRIESSFYHAPVVFNRVLPPSPDTKKTKHKTVKTERKTPKPIKLENEKVVTGSLKFCDVVGTTPAIMKLNPSLTGYTLTALPVKLPDNYCYDLARYIAGNVPKMSAINYLHDQIKHLQVLSCDKFGGVPRTDLISMLGNLKEGVRDDKKIDPAKFIESKNKLREYLNNAPFLTSTRDAYYGFYELAKVGIKQEIEDQEYQYRLTNLSPDDKAFYRHNLTSVLNFVRGVTSNLRTHFGVNKPDTGEIRKYLQSKFSYSNCKLNVYYGEKQPRKGLIMEISYRDNLFSEHHIQIIEPANLNPIYIQMNEEGKKEEHARHYGILPTKLSIFPSFNDHNDDAIFYALLRCQKTDKELVTFAKAQLIKVINKYISANRNKLVGENKNAVQTTIAKSVGFIDTGHGYNAIKKTFLKFLRPFTSESAVSRGKVVDLKTLKPYSDHDSTFLLEKITANWKTWNKSNDRLIELGQQQFRKENPGKLMLNVSKLIESTPELSTIIWDDLINTFYQLSQLSIGFKANNGVILTPFDIYSNDVERWEHRIKIQLISILKEGDKTRTLGIESLLQREIKDLYSILDRLSPNWNTDRDVNEHLAELHDCLSTAKKLNP